MRLFVRAREGDPASDVRLLDALHVQFNRAVRLQTTFGYGCASETPIELPVVGPVAELGGHWEVDYARSDTVQTQINASFREVSGRFAEGRRRSSAAAIPRMPLGDLDT